MHNTAFEKTVQQTLRAAALLLAGGLLAAGCAAPAPKQPATILPISSGLSMFQERTPLLSTPMDIRYDYVYPSYHMRQRLVWTDHDNQWQLTFPSQRYAYGGIEFRQRMNMSAARARAKIVFRIKPARLVRYLSVGLIAHPDKGERCMTDVWLQDLAKGPLEGEGWAEIEIPLARFPDRAVPVIKESSSPVPVQSLECTPFDWTTVRELRFISSGGRIPQQQVTVRALRYLR